MNKPLEILLIEDNDGDVFLFKESFKSIKKRPFNLSVCRDGEEAMDFLHRSERFSNAPVPNLIFLDLNLPKINGLEILKEIKESMALKSIPVIVFTSSDSDKDIKKSYDYHANCYIRKPISIEKFREIAAGIEKFWFEITEMPPS